MAALRVTFRGSYVTFQPDGTVPVSGNGSVGRVKLISRDGLRVDILVDRGGLIRQTPPYKTGLGSLLAAKPIGIKLCRQLPFNQICLRTPNLTAPMIGD